MVKDSPAVVPINRVKPKPERREIAERSMQSAISLAAVVGASHTFPVADASQADKPPPENWIENTRIDPERARAPCVVLGHNVHACLVRTFLLGRQNPGRGHAEADLAGGCILAPGAVFVRRHFLLFQRFAAQERNVTRGICLL